MMKILDEYEMSKWAFRQCLEGNDTEEMRSIITNPQWCWRYYVEIKHDEVMLHRILNSKWAGYFLGEYLDDNYR